MQRKKKRRMIRGGMLGILFFCLIGAAHAAVTISPVDPTNHLPIVTSTVTVSIFQNGVDVTGTWLPEPGQAVTIVVNGLASATIGLVPPPATITFTGTTNPFLNATTLTTSAYPGQCTNFGSNTDLSPDFTLVGNTLTPTDCGGMAVIQVNGTYTFILPADSDVDGMPDNWEARYGAASGSTSLAPLDDKDPAPVSSTIIGDGISNFDEYRGFIVSGQHIRTDPRQKDLFVHVVNPQCLPAGTDPLTSTSSFLGGGTTTYVSGAPFFTNLNTLINGTQVHLLGYMPNSANYKTDEWVDNFDSYSLSTGIVWRDPANAVTTTSQPTGDRQINANALYPVLDSVTKLKIQKGLRLIECVVNDTGTTLGVAALGSPNGQDNAILYTNRIISYLNGLIGTSTTIKYSFFTAGAWSTPVSITRVDLIGRAMEFYLAMEIGHSLSLTPTVEGTNKTSYGYHHAPGTGSNLDQAITNKVSNSTGNTFYIPIYYNSSDLANFKLNN